METFHGKQFDVVRGDSFHSKEHTNMFYELSGSGIAFNGEPISNFEFIDDKVHYKNSNDDKYSGTSQNRGRCLLIYDEKTLSFTLQRLYTSAELNPAMDSDHEIDDEDMEYALDTTMAEVMSSSAKPISLSKLYNNGSGNNSSSDESSSDGSDESSSSSGEDVGLMILSQIALFYSAKYVLDSVYGGERKMDKKTLTKVAKLQSSGVKLNKYEESIAAELISVDDIDTTFESIGGLDDIISDMKETVIYPLMYPQLYSSSDLLSAPKGVLLYGPPGCGKTLLAKALAKESGAYFINLHLSTLTEQWFGESQKLTRAVFTLARKIQPVIVFIDEIDSFLKNRTSNDHEATSMMKAEFMTLWDGLASESNSRIVILGATNRPNDIDAAFLRRMPKKFSIGLPNEAQRRRILNILLKDSEIEENFDFDEIVQKTNHYTGSDLKELCRNALMIPVRESIREHDRNVSSLSKSSSKFNVRPVRTSDFFPADTKLPKIELD